MEELALLKRKLVREKLARKAAETILEERALELYESNEKLRKLNNELELKVEKRAKQLIKNEEKYRQIIENMELGLLEVDNDQIIIRAYDWFCDMTGYSQEELIGKNAAEVLVPNQRHLAVIDQEQRKRKKGQAGVFEIQIQHKLGHLIWVMISGCPVYDEEGQVIGSVGIHYEISRQKKLQKALLQAKKTAEKAQKAEQLFLAKMSHEIRTPLNAIIGMSHLLNATNPNDEQKEYLKILGDSSNILKLLISDILDFSKIQAGEINIQKSEFNLTELILRLQNAIQSQIEGYAVKVKASIDPRLSTMVIADELMLNQILINLLSNARKFTKEGEIKISVTILNETEDKLDLSFVVSDTGTGFSPEKKELIFQNFKQISNEGQEEINGTGLGLAIIKQLVELQSGRITVDSEVNKGSIFSVFLTYEKGGLPKKKVDRIDQHQISEKFENQRILVVEDNYMNQKYILTLLSKWNLNFSIAEDGIAAIAITQKEKFDLIFMDISMPRLNGYKATEQIRKASNLNHGTPIIALSASAFVDNKEKAMKMGMTDFLCKPFEPEGLLRIISQYIAKRPEYSTQAGVTEGFSFSPPLDTMQLSSLYADNWQMALMLFKIFIDTSLPSFNDFGTLMEDGDFIAIKKLAHKLAPNLRMVGLMDINAKLLRLEVLAEEGKAKVEMTALIDEIMKDLKNAEPILQKTIKRFELIFQESPAN